MMREPSDPTIESQHLESLSQKFGKLDTVTLLAIMVGFVPLFSGLLFQTYQYHATPGWYEALRQLDFPFIFVELGIVFWACVKGLSFKSFFEELPTSYKIAAIIFTATFSIGSIFFSPQPGYSMLRLSYWPIHIGFTIAVWHLLRNAPSDQLRSFAHWMVMGVAAYIPLLCLHFMLAPDPRSTELGEIIWSSAVPGCLSVRHFGIWIGGVLALWIGHSGWLQSGNKSVFKSWIITMLLMLLMFWSGTRGAMIATLAVLILASVVMVRLPTLSEFIALISVSAIAILLSTMLFTPDTSFGVLAPDRYRNVDVERMSAGRVEIWLYSFDKFLENPIFGWGEGALYWLLDFNGEAHLQPHNSIVQFLFSWGIIATVAAGFVMIRILWTLHINVRKIPEMLAPLMLLDSTLIMSLFDGALYFSRMIIPGAIGLALCFVLLGRAQAENIRLQK
jgi:exopolysaccharide production protein ExoQ